MSSWRRSGDCVGAVLAQSWLMALRGWLISVFLWTSCVAVLAADGQLPLSKPPVRKQIVETVETQLAAFRADDWTAAYACASKPFRARISLETFVVLITRSYPHVWKNLRADVGLSRDDGSTARVPVRVFVGNGVSSEYDYLLVKEKVGWRVSGVLPKTPAGPGT
jgi:hypothetical protein